MGVWSSVAGALDHAAGSTDEATGRFIDQSNQVAESDLGPVQRASGYSRLFVRHTLGEQVEETAWTSPSGQFAGNEDDIDVAGPGAGETVSAGLNVVEAGTDLATQSADESAAERWGEKAALYGIIALVVIGVISYVFGPAISAASSVAEVSS